MSEEKFYNSEHPNLPEHSALPEHSSLPEYNPVYPDVSFFKESAVTTKEENIFQGEPPAGESRRVSRDEKRKERERFSLLQKILGLACRGGAAVLAATVMVSAVSSAQDGGLAAAIRGLVQSGKKPAFTQQTGYDVDALARLWERDPDAPHKYDTEHPLVFVEATCTQDGEAEYVCLECGVHSHAILTSGGHQESEPVRENVTEATCQSEGGYTEIITCKVCGQELSRSTVVVAKTDHTPGEPLIENEVEPTCEEDGHRDETVTCTVCGEVISSETVTIPATGHVAAAAVRENETEAICEKGGSYDNVVYCSVCNKELSRETVVQTAAGHTPAAAVKENEVAATCEEEGSYDNVVYCSVCQKELSRDTVKVAALGHNWGTPTYTWASDGSTVTATRVCSNDSSHVETETMQAARTVTSEATCDTGETVRCTASFSNPAFTTQTKNVTGEPLGHEWETEYYWERTNTGYICYAHAYCLRDENHILDEEVEGTRSVQTEPTCEDEGTYLYTASFSDSAFTTQTEEAIAPALGHDYQYLKQYEAVTCTYKQYYYISKCSRCGELEPDAVPSQAEFEDGDGHNWISSGGQIICGNCGNAVVEAYYNNGVITYYLSEDYMTEKNISDQEIKLWSYDQSSYVDDIGYNWGTSNYTGTIEVSGQYADPGNRLRVDVTFSDGSVVRSNDVTVQ